MLGPYQLTPAASKGNAFCWLSYTSQIDWGIRPQAGQRKRTDIIEHKRSLGIDPLHIPGLGSAKVTGPRDPMRFAVQMQRQGANATDGRQR
jgi:hypothetical protein